MNVHRTFRSNMTSKCQVTIPKEIRDALGLKAGDRVEFELTDDGRARIVPVSREDERAAHKARIMRGVAEARQLFRPQGMSNQEFYDLMRGPSAEV
ncbi:MAG TPA: AbrB/MazE/SpoVT family DNA-binding domain-containing protein [Novosphingobium sp.]|nr:AbrB/MazE/SpoVT family DNA-binding domain-containing protein [Novosphingobium sp.]